MRIPGRFWWGQALLACGAAAGAIVAPTLYLSSSLQIDSELGDSSLFRTDIALAATFSLVMLAFDLVFIRIATRSLDGYRRRRRALRGDIDALALAVASASVGDAPQQLEVPLVLHWRRKRGILLFLALYSTFLLICMAVGLVVLGYTLVSYGNLGDVVQHASTPGNLSWEALPLLTIIAEFMVWCIFGIVVARIVWFQWRHVFGVTATAEGLECVTPFGRQTFIPWSEARLFEVETRASGALGKRTWRLYGSREMATWVYFPLSWDLIPDGISTVEMKLRQDALTRLITARTGLAPRTLSKALITTSSAAPRRLWLAVTFYMLFIAMTLALAVAVIMAPLTDTPWLNVAFSLPLVVAAIQMVRRFRRYLRAMSQQSLHSDVGQDSALIFSSKDDLLQGKVYALWIRPSRAARARSFLFGALLATELLPAIQAILSLLSPDAPPALHFSLSTLPTLPFFSLTGALVWALGYYGLFGLSPFMLALYRARPTIRADDVGLSTTSGNYTFTYPWSDIGEIREVVEGDKVVSYTVHNRAGRMLFRWPAHPANTAPLTYLPDAEPISAAALAQLVSQRIGGA